jgi:hypothetical protein
LLSKNIKITIFKIIIFPAVLYGCETWSLTMKEERRLWVCENRMSRRIFGPKRYEVTGEWRKLIMKSLMICTAHPILCGLRVGPVACMEKSRGVYMVLAGKPERNRPLGRPRHR